MPKMTFVDFNWSNLLSLNADKITDGFFKKTWQSLSFNETTNGQQK